MKINASDVLNPVREVIDYGDPSTSCERSDCIVNFGGFTVTAKVLTSSIDKQIGMQKYSHIPETSGLLFLYSHPTTPVFHMGRTQFPIDIVFLELDSSGQDSELNHYSVGKIVHNLQPGDSQEFSHSNTSAVVELAGNTCKHKGICTGDSIEVLHRLQGEVKSPRVNQLLEKGTIVQLNADLMGEEGQYIPSQSVGKITSINQSTATIDFGETLGQLKIDTPVIHYYVTQMQSKEEDFEDVVPRGIFSV